MDFEDPRDPAGFRAHIHGVRHDQVLHACPRCGIVDQLGLSAVQAFCPLCSGTGLVDEATLARDQLMDQAGLG